MTSSFYSDAFQNCECLERESADMAFESTEDKMTIRCLIYDDGTRSMRKRACVKLRHPKVIRELPFKFS
jgi:hypothetical protein